MLFEGENINNRKNGIGKEYHDSGRLMFRGEFLYGYRKKGKYYIKNQLEYEGEFYLIKNGME